MISVTFTKWCSAKKTTLFQLLFETIGDRDYVSYVVRSYIGDTDLDVDL